MATFIILSNNQSLLDKYVVEFCRKHDIDTLDIVALQTETASIGIEDIRRLQQKLFLKPLKSQQKLIIIPDAQKLTVEAQNSLLKTLEEPPEATFIFLTSANVESFLPTIISRCQIVTLESKQTELTSEDEVIYETIFAQLFASGVGEKLALAQKVGDKKDEVVMWLEKAILILRMRMLDAAAESTNNGDSIQWATVLDAFLKTYNIIKTTNVNVRLAVEHLFLGM